MGALCRKELTENDSFQFSYLGFRVVLPEDIRNLTLKINTYSNDHPVMKRDFQ